MQTPKQKAVMAVIGKQPLTSREILQKLKTVNLLLELYPALEALRKQGVIKSFNKGETRYHCAA